MNVFVLNRGSSSIKCYLYAFQEGEELPIVPRWEAHLEWKNLFDEPSLTVKNAQGAQLAEVVQEKTAGDALRRIVRLLVEGTTAVLSSLDQVDAIGHRIVHGGRFFKESVRIDAKVKDTIRELSELAPLHNLPELEGIEILEEVFAKTPQIAVFDTAFHHTLPQAAEVYPVPYSWFEKGIKRYGFHGISYQYCSRKAKAMLGSAAKMLVCHLGSGASLCAVQDGKSIDTTMGFTPLEGLMMDTRSGSIDPGILLFMLEKKKMSPNALSDALYKESGLLGISGTSSDMRDIIEKSEKGDFRALLAFEVYMHRLTAMMGAMIASLKGLDALVFTAGIGENAPLVRQKVCETFSFLGMQLDLKKNTAPSREDCLLSSQGSRVNVLLIHTQEAFEIARECWKRSND